jgi:TIR domain
VIEELVETVPCIVVLWSKDSVESRWVNAESREGLDRGVLVPVCLDDAEPPLVFREVQWLSFRGWDGESEPPEIERLAADVRAVVTRSREGAGTAPAAAGTKPSPVSWTAVAALAGGALLGAAFVFLDVLGGLLEAVADLARRPGLAVPPALVQTAALVLIGLYLLRQRRRVWPLPAARAVRLAACAFAIVLGAGLVYDWSREGFGSRRDHILGVIQAADRGGMRVRALDSLGRDISPGGAPVDGEDGTFVLRFEPVFGDRPRQLEVSRPGCAPETYPIGRRRWRDQGRSELRFTCRSAS